MIENSVTINADTVEEAIDKGLNQLGITRDQAEIRIISEGKKGFLGFGKQDAIVVVNAQINQSLSELTQALEEEENISIQEDTKEFPTETLQTKEDDLEKSTLDSSKEEISREVQSETHSVPQIQDIVENEKEVSSDKINAVKEENNLGDEGSDTDEEDSSLDKENQMIELDKASQVVANYLIEIIEEYGAKADIEVERQGNHVIFNIDTDKSGLIIGKHGKIINSLQILAQTLLHHHYRHRANVTLNVGDYRDRRANILEQMAQRTADEVLKTKQPAILDSLPAYERKQIHAYLSKIDHLRTHSEGKDPNRYLVVEYVNE